MSDPVREYLQDKGCGEHVISRGLLGLVENWEQVVESVSDGYNLGLDDYLNDMDVRQLLAEAILIASHSEKQRAQSRIVEADEQIKSHLHPAEECLWGDEVAAEEGWTRQQNWWYFNYPENAGEDLRDELGRD